MWLSFLVATCSTYGASAPYLNQASNHNPKECIMAKKRKAAKKTAKKAKKKKATKKAAKKK
jgi:hypothetical protein